jgi:hypothetical protein
VTLEQAMPKPVSQNFEAKLAEQEEKPELEVEDGDGSRLKGTKEGRRGLHEVRSCSSCQND